MRYHVDKLPFSIHKGTPYKLDKDGVIMSKIPYTQEYHYHLTSIASYVIETRNESNLDWIKKNLDSEGIYKHDFTFPWYPMEKGWVGGLAQGLAVSALSRNCEHYYAKKALEGLKKYCLKDGIVYEYPGIEVLNGWIYALFGIYDGNDMITFYSCIDKLKERLEHYYITSLWSLYDGFGMPSTIFYHDVVTEQMKALYKLTDDEYFLNTYRYMINCRESMRSVYYAKIKRLLLTLSKHRLSSYKRYRARIEWLR